MRPALFLVIVNASLGLALAGCAGDLNPVRDAATAVGAGAPPRQAPDFISQSRPAQVDYIPVGTAAPTRSSAKTREQIAATEAELERTRAANERRGQDARALGGPPVAAP